VGCIEFFCDLFSAKAAIGNEKVALSVVIGVQKDGSNRFLATESGDKSLQLQPISQITIVHKPFLTPRDFKLAQNHGPGFLAIARSQEQLCWNHKILYVLDAVSTWTQYGLQVLAYSPSSSSSWLILLHWLTI
jgi:hypothetical protein